MISSGSTTNNEQHNTNGQRMSNDVGEKEKEGKKRSAEHKLLLQNREEKDRVNHKTTRVGRNASEQLKSARCRALPDYCCCEYERGLSLELGTRLFLIADTHARTSDHIIAPRAAALLLCRAAALLLCCSALPLCCSAARSKMVLTRNAGRAQSSIIPPRTTIIRSAYV